MSCLLNFPRKTADWEGLLFEILFQGCVKWKGQGKVYKKENWKGFLSFDDFIRNDNRLSQGISSYFKEVKIKELQIWKGDVRSLAGSMVLDDKHLLSGDEPRKSHQELQVTEHVYDCYEFKEFKEEDWSWRIDLD